MRGRVLVVAGSDSGGGAGIQADIKTITALGAYAATAITALTAQDTWGVHGIMAVPAGFVVAQMHAVLDDIGADVVKTGMLGDAALIEAVCDALGPGRLVVVDPVMVATSGDRLLDPAALDTLRRRLLPMAAVLTPNLPEAEALTGMRITGEADMVESARALLGMGPGAVLLKGGHLDGESCADLLMTADGTEVFRAPRIATRNTHGTGCTLASAIAAGLAQGLPLSPAVARAHAYVQAAIASAPGYGGGHGPLDHATWIAARSA